MLSLNQFGNLAINSQLAIKTLLQLQQDFCLIDVHECVYH